MLHIWDAIEADFSRDYRIDLMEQIDQMSWRRFLVLLNNLSPYGATAMRIRALDNKKSAEDTTEEEDKRAADQFFSSILTV